MCLQPAYDTVLVLAGHIRHALAGHVYGFRAACYAQYAACVLFATSEVGTFQCYLLLQHWRTLFLTQCEIIQ
jgi:hypothetical protein